MSERTYTDEEAAQVAARRGMPRFVKLALRQEGLSRKAKEEPKFKFHDLYGQVLLVDTLRCAWERARANKGKDRVVQAAVKLVMEPIFEADFHDCSYGFGPGRNAQMAVERIAAEIRGREGQGV